jgi:phosphopantetheinyl transferase (holo-ACP synthase)
MQQGTGIDINELERIVAALTQNDAPPCSAQAVLSRIQ